MGAVGSLWQCVVTPIPSPCNAVISSMVLKSEGPAVAGGPEGVLQTTSRSQDGCEDALWQKV